ncbi:MAG: diaminopimelate epimerase [Bacteroidales bacterium]|nr:diaminopimelate epimerase [Bacteroidales bacterium]
MEKNFFVKSHGLGNDYIVLDQNHMDFKLTASVVKRISDVHFGIGSDGILLKTDTSKADFGLRIFNPDGSEAEKSGNGLRIFCKYLYDYEFTKAMEFTVETIGGIVHANILETTNNKARIIRVDMGQAVFEPSKIPVNLGIHECINEVLIAGDREFRINCVSVGNPHCVIIKGRLDMDEILKYGPLIENHAAFPNRINVQFARRVSSHEVEILIWERGAGYTLASGSSSCAVACIMAKTKRTGNDVTIKMKGGDLKIQIDDHWNIKMTGEVREIASGHLSPELLKDIG